MDTSSTRWCRRSGALAAKAFGIQARHLTDLYLLALAVPRQGRLVSFDQRIPLSAVVGAGPQHLVVL